MTESKQPKRSEASTPNGNEDEVSPELKKARLLLENDASPSLSYPQTADGQEHPPIRWLIDDSTDDVFSKIPVSLCGGISGNSCPDIHKTKAKIGQDLDKLRTLLNAHGLRTSKISSPREAVSIYTQSCTVQSTGIEKDTLIRDGKEFLWITFGLHPEQEAIERAYERFTKNSYCILLFCQRLRKEYSFGMDATVSDAPKDLQRLFLQIEETYQSVKEFQQKNRCGVTSQFTEEKVNSLIDLATKVKGKRCYRKEEWRKEYQRICVSNSTISNAYVSLLQAFHGMCIKDVYLKLNKQEPKYERITIYLYDPAIDYGRRPNYFSFLPGLRTFVTRGPDALVSEMIDAFWVFVIRKGYFPPSKLRKVLDAKLVSFFLAGITPSSPATGNSKNLPLPLKANFVPTVPFSIYLHGKAGAGKSSLAKVLPTALQSTLEKFVDPECVARFVKQNLNKRIKTLELEFELRPNNNDMSIMSIIQGRRMAMSQSKPGLVVLNLEEMPMDSSQSNPNQLSVAQLISQRFGGRKGNYQQEQNINTSKYAIAPRNSDKRSIGKDCSLVTIFTSNYSLAEDSKLALEQLQLYQSLLIIEMSAITGSDRCQFAKSYLRQCLLDSLGSNRLEIATENILLDISAGSGDTRPLVRQLRMYSYYLAKLVENKFSPDKGSVIVDSIRVAQSKDSCILTIEGHVGGEATRTKQQNLKIGSLGNWFPTGAFQFDPKIQLAMEMLSKLVDANQAAELAVILEFWLSATLAPAVVLSRDRSFVKCLMSAIHCMGNGIHSIRNVDASSYKMTKSLYDPKEMPNLRDDILRFGAGALVTTELNCPTADSQLCIREMIEDSPSMTAFSSTKSALYKSGLLFAIYVEGDITPEILSRVSIVI